MFLFYSAVILLTILVVPFILASFLLYILLFSIALYAARQAFLQQEELLLSESSLVERMMGRKCFRGKISTGSFYNGFFVFLRLEMKEEVISGKIIKQSLIIYKDAINENQYRLLARLINSGRK